jgi:hypothetical protein
MTGEQKARRALVNEAGKKGERASGTARAWDDQEIVGPT